MKIIIVDTLLSFSPFKKRWQVFSEHLNECDWVDHCTLISVSNDPLYKYEMGNLALGRMKMEAGVLDKLFHYVTCADENTVFIFTTANNSMVVRLHEYRCQSGRRFKMLGYWNDASQYRPGLLRQIYAQSELSWLKQHEKSLAYCYDYNLYPSEMEDYGLKQLELSIKAGELAYCPYPFDVSFENTLKIASEHENVIKQNIGLFTNLDITEHTVRLQEIVTNTFPKVDFYSIHTDFHHSENYFGALSKSKLVFSITKFDLNPYSIIDAMAFGCIPLLPSIKIYKKLFPEKYLYNNSILNPPFLKFVRNGQKVFDTINEILTNYNGNDVVDDAKKIVKEYYSSQPLKDILCDLKN